MSSSPTVPLWRGRALALVGIVLCAFSLRSAVASLSPVLDRIAADFEVSSAVAGLIGTAPPVCFAVFGILTPLLERRIGLERLLAVALAAITVGLIGRGLVDGAAGLLAATAVIFAGVGMGNILLPPLVKKYFSDRIGLLMTLYTTVMAVSTFLPPLFAVPIADAAGWRVSLAIWAVFAFAGLIPWAVLAVTRGRRDGTADGAPDSGRPSTRRTFARLARLPLTWALAITFGTSSTMAYVSFAWLPTIMTDISGVGSGTAGLLLSLFGFIGLPMSLLVPVLVVRFQATRPLFLVGIVSGLLGVLGMLLLPAPSVLWLWVVLFGMTGLLFPLSLVLISVSARTPTSAVVLSSFVQSAGYIFAAVFPFLVGVLHDASGSWTVPLLVIGAVLLIVVPAGLRAGGGRTVEDEWERRNGSW